MKRTLDLGNSGALSLLTSSIVVLSHILLSGLIFLLLFPNILRKSPCLLCQEPPKKIMTVIFFSGPEFTLCKQGAREQITVSVALRPFYSDFRNLERIS